MRPLADVGGTAHAARNLRVIFAARTAMSAARSLAGVITAVYLSAIGFSALGIGAVFLVVSLSSAVLSSVVGIFADRIGRKPFLVVVPFLAGLAAVVFATTRQPWALVVAAAAGSFGRGAGAGGGSVGPYQPAESALLAETAPGSSRTGAFTRLTIFSTLGATAGGLLARLVDLRGAPSGALMVAFRPAFLAAGALACTAGLLALLIREEPARGVARPNKRAQLLPRLSGSALWRLSVTNSVNSMSMGMIGPFVTFWFYQRFGASPASIGSVFAVVNIVSLVSISFAPRLARIGTVRAIMLVRCVGGALLVPLAFAPHFAVAAGIYALRVVAQRVGLPLQQSYVQEVTHPHERARVAALSSLPSQGSQAASQVLAGYLFEEVSLGLPFVLAAGLQIVDVALYGILLGHYHPAWEVPFGEAAIEE